MTICLASSAQDGRQELTNALTALSQDGVVRCAEAKLMFSKLEDGGLVVDLLNHFADGGDTFNVKGFVDFVYDLSSSGNFPRPISAPPLKRVKSSADFDPYRDAVEDAGGQAAIGRNRLRSQRCDEFVRFCRQKFGDPALQPWQQDPIFRCLTYENLEEVSDSVKTTFDALLAGVVSMLNERMDGERKVFLRAGVKGAERGKKKCRVKYAGDPSQMSDMVRATVLVKGSIDDLYEVVETLLNYPELCTVNAHFTHFVDRYQSPLGNYRDILTLLRISNFVCELQFNLHSVSDIKESADGHAYYEMQRLANDDLLIATIENDLHTAQDAIHRGARPRRLAESMSGLSTVHFAAFHGNQEMMRLLLEHGADPLATAYDGQLALQRAVQRGHDAVVNILIENMDASTLADKLDMPSIQHLLGCMQVADARGQFPAVSFCRDVLELAFNHWDSEVRIAAAEGIGPIDYDEKEEVRLATLDGSRREQMLKAFDVNNIPELLEFADDPSPMLKLSGLAGSIAKAAWAVGWLLRSNAATITGLDLMEQSALGTDESMEAICQGVGDDTTLAIEWFRAKHTSITPTGAMFFAKFLQRCPSLRKVDFGVNKYLFTAEGLDGFLRGLGEDGTLNVQEIDVYDCSISADAGAKFALFLQRCPQLKRVQNLHTNKELFTAAGLDLVLHGLGDQGTLSLEDIDVYDCSLDEESSKYFAKILAKCPKLKTVLSIHTNKDLFTADALKEFLYGLGDEGTLTLERLNLTECYIRDDACKYLAMLLKRCPQLGSVDELCTNKDLFTAKGLQKFLEGLGTDGMLTLEEVDVRDCCISKEACKYLAMVLSRCPLLTRVHNLRTNPAFFSPAGLGNFVDGLGDEGTLSVVDIDVRNCHITTKACKPLASLLTRCPVLKTITNLYTNKKFFTAKGLEQFVEGLGDEGALSLEEIHADYLCMEAEAGYHLAMLLKKCQSLKIVDLEGNDELFSEKGMTRFLEGLGDSGILSVEEFYLSHNSIGVHAARTLGEVLTRCPKLRKSGLQYGNPELFSTEGVEELLTGLGCDAESGSATDATLNLEDLELKKDNNLAEFLVVMLQMKCPFLRIV